MNPEYIFCIEDDWELRGNGQGNVADLQYATLRFYLDLARRHGLKITFMVEALQQLQFLRHQNDSRDIRLQAHIWSECLAMMTEAGHDVQLHLHPQWYAPTYRNGIFKVEGSWNISDYPPSAIQAMISEAMDYLRGSLAAIAPQSRLMAFKAGTWAMQPSEKILPVLEAAGIRIVMGPSAGVRYRGPNFVADYSAIEEPARPYFPDYAQVERLASGPRGIVVLPLPYYRRGFVGLVRRGAEYAERRISGRTSAAAPPPATIPPDMKATSPIGKYGARSKLKGALDSLQELRVFDVADASFGELKFGFDQIIANLPRQGWGGPKVVVIQSHTKGFYGNWSSIERFFAYAAEKFHGRTQWLTLSELGDRLAHLHPRSAAHVP